MAIWIVLCPGPFPSTNKTGKIKKCAESCDCAKLHRSCEKNCFPHNTFQKDLPRMELDLVSPNVPLLTALIIGGPDDLGMVQLNFIDCRNLEVSYCEKGEGNTV